MQLKVVTEEELNILDKWFHDNCIVRNA